MRLGITIFKVAVAIVGVLIFLFGLSGIASHQRWDLVCFVLLVGVLITGSAFSRTVRTASIFLVGMWCAATGALRALGSATESSILGLPPFPESLPWFAWLGIATIAVAFTCYSAVMMRDVLAIDAMLRDQKRSERAA